MNKYSKIDKHFADLRSELPEGIYEITVVENARSIVSGVCSGQGCHKEHLRVLLAWLDGRQSDKAKIDFPF